jgi:hypothetical protein
MGSETMIQMSQMVNAKREQWGKEALMVCARHGLAGGAFKVETWANGKLMASAILADGSIELPWHSIPVEVLSHMQANGWRVVI